jgi:acyl-CoA reductase-like NAD-dependent aldehyde dehydrogenase
VTRTLEWRIEQLDRLAGLLAANEKRLQKAIAADFKTAPQEYVLETLASGIEAEYQKSQLKNWMAPIEAPVPRFLAEAGYKGMVYREPYGVTLVIAPFNGPLLLLIRPALTALAAGNTCILKLSEALPATSNLLLELIPKHLDPRAVTAVRGHREETAELLKLPFDFIFFTGSTNTGKVVARAAAENLTPVLLELGGQNPALVDPTANIPDAAKKIVWGAMAWGGQWCTSPGYAYVHESVAEAFVNETRKAVIELHGSNPKSNPDYSRIISEREVARLAALIEPAKIVSGGHPSQWLEPRAEKSPSPDPTVKFAARTCDAFEPVRKNEVAKGQRPALPSARWPRRTFLRRSGAGSSPVSGPPMVSTTVRVPSSNRFQVFRPSSR